MSDFESCPFCGGEHEGHLWCPQCDAMVQSKRAAGEQQDATSKAHPCPFCGGAVTRAFEGECEAVSNAEIWCDACQLLAIMPCIDAWNRRAHTTATGSEGRA